MSTSKALKNIFQGKILFYLLDRTSAEVLQLFLFFLMEITALLKGNFQAGLTQTGGSMVEKQGLLVKSRAMSEVK